MDDYPIRRIRIWASCQPVSMPHSDMIALVKAAGLEGTVIDAEVRALPAGLMTVNQEVVRSLLRMVEKRGS